MIPLKRKKIGRKPSIEGLTKQTIHPFESNWYNKAMNQPSSTTRTVFVRFLPPSANIRRHHLEDLFSQIGPIKKSSVIVPHAKGSSSEKKGNQQQHNDDGEEASAHASSYGFVKYIAEEDAQKAAEKLNRSMLRISAEEKIQLRVERASDVANNKKTNHHKKEQHHTADGGDTAAGAAADNDDDGISHKKTSRLILRNLSFYAKESHIRQALQAFGPIEEVHLPTVSDKKGGSSPSTKGKTFHRGFGFVTFVNPKDAQKCLQAKEIEIYKRKVQVAKALHKAGYEKIKHNENDRRAPKSSPEKKSEHDAEQGDEAESSSDDDDESAGSSDSDDNDDKENADGASDKDDDEDDEGSSTSSSESESEKESDKEDDEEGNNKDQDDERETKDTTAVAEKRSLFLRNLPFDATRHDIFEAFRKYGRISGIYIVKDKQSGMPRGTAFLSFESQASTQRALKASGTENFTSQREVTEGKDTTLNTVETLSSADGGITVRGRHVFVNLAVDKDTASTLTLDKKSDRSIVIGKDRRNLFLKGEGRVDNEGENTLWDQLPEQDKLKRQKAWSDKNTKLRSPLFLISPTRLSIRNLAKDVDDRSLKKLCVTAVQRGLKNKLVAAEDQIALWRAAGEMTTREILEKIDSLDDKDQIIPEFDEKNVRKFIPSVAIERDFSTNKKDGAPSRGFGFVEFLHHTHALACLRELNNNTAYSEEYVSGGKQAMSQRGRKPKKKRKVGEEVEVKVPRLIVEFSVENRAKAKKHADHKIQQRANKIKQKIENKEKDGDSEKKKEKKKSRGKRQRERKRKQKDDGVAETVPEEESNPTKKAKVSKDTKENELDRKKDNKTPKAVKPSKKRKVDKAEENLSKLVDSYQDSLTTTATKAAEKNPETQKKVEKRWFET